MNRRKFLLGAPLLALLPAARVYAMDIAIVDPGQWAASIAFWAKQLAEMRNMVVGIADTVQQAKFLVAAVQNPEMIVDLALGWLDSELADTLPDEYYEAADALRSIAGSILDITSRSEMFEREMTSITTDHFHDPNGVGARSWQAYIKRKAQRVVFEDAVYRQSNRREIMIRQIIQRIGQSNLKGSIDESNFIAAQKLRLDNIQHRLDMLRESEKLAIENQQRKDREARTAADEKGPPPLAPATRTWRWRTPE